MRAIILPYAIILSKARMMAKGCIVALILPPLCFLFLLPNYILYSMQTASLCLGTKGTADYLGARI